MLLGASWPDALTALVALLSAPLALIGIFQAGKAVRDQNTSSDIQTVLSIWEKIDSHWARFRAAKSEPEKNFEFGQLSGYYELACGLFKDGILTTKAARTLEEHLDEILPIMRGNAEFAHRFESLVTSKTTFANITWFCNGRK